MLLTQRKNYLKWPIKATSEREIAIASSPMKMPPPTAIIARKSQMSSALLFVANSRISATHTMPKNKRPAPRKNHTPNVLNMAKNGLNVLVSSREVGRTAVGELAICSFDLGGFPFPSPNMPRCCFNVFICGVSVSLKYLLTWAPLKYHGRATITSSPQSSRKKPDRKLRPYRETINAPNI